MPSASTMTSSPTTTNWSDPCPTSLRYVFYCQALVPSPVPLDPIPNPKQSKSKSKSNWDWGDTIITWATHPPPITFNHEGVL